MPETNAKSPATVNEVPASLISKDEFETTINAETTSFDPQQSNTTSKRYEPAPDHKDEYDLTEESIDSTDLDSISSSGAASMNVTGDINETQLELNSPAPMADSDTAASTDAADSEPAQSLNIEKTGDDATDQSMHSEMSEETENLDETTINSNTQPDLDSISSVADYDESSASKTMEAAPVEPSGIDENKVIVQDMQEKEFRETGTEGEQPSKPGPIEDPKGSAPLDPDPTAETGEVEDTKNIQSETSQVPALPDAEKTIEENSSHNGTAEISDSLPAKEESDVLP